MSNDFGRPIVPAKSNQFFDEVAPKPTRDVPSGTPWVFLDHRTLAAVIADERRS